MFAFICSPPSFEITSLVAVSVYHSNGHGQLFSSLPFWVDEYGMCRMNRIIPISLEQFYWSLVFIAATLATSMRRQCHCFNTTAPAVAPPLFFFCWFYSTVALWHVWPSIQKMTTISFAPLIFYYIWCDEISDNHITDVVAVVVVVAKMLLSQCIIAPVVECVGVGGPPDKQNKNTKRERKKKWYAYGNYPLLLFLTSEWGQVDVVETPNGRQNTHKH